MRTLAYFPLLLLALFGFASCGIVEDVVPDIEFTVDGNEVTFLLPTADQAGEFILTESNVSSGVAEELTAESVASDRVESIRMSTLNLRITTANPAVDLSVLADARVRIASANVGNATLAFTEFTQVSGTEVLLDVTDTDIASFLTQPTVDYQLILHTNAPVPQELDLTIRPQFTVVARPI